MPAKMTVLSLAHTGHVLAAIAEPPTGPVAIEALVGAAFPLRTTRRRDPAVVSFDASFALPASILKLKSVAYDGRVMARPQAFAVNGGLIAELPAADPPTVFSLNAGAVVPDYGLPVPTEAKKVLVVVRHQSDPRIQRIQAGAFAANEQTAGLNLAIVPDGPAATLATGIDYFVAIAAEGKRLGYGLTTAP